MPSTLLLPFLLFLITSLQARASTSIFPLPDPECILASYPSVDGNPDPSFDGSFETAKPLAQNSIGLGPTTLTGCVCKKGFTGPFQSPLFDGIIPAFAGLTDAACNDTCVAAEERFGYLPGSNSFMTALDQSTFALGATFVIVGDTLTPEFPNLRFYMAFDDVTGNEAAHEVAIEQFYVQVFDEANEVGDFVNLGRLELLSDANVSNTDCGSSKWAQFTIPLASFLESQQFAQLNFSLRTTQLVFAIETGDQLVAVDNIEFVGPALTNQTLIDLIAVPELQTELKSSELSVLGEDAFDAIFAVVAILSLVCALGISVFAYWSESRELVEYIIRTFALVWLFVSMALTVYAVVEYFQFIEDASEFDAAANALAEEVQQILKLDGFDPRQLRRITDGKAVYGAFSLPLPRLDRSQVEAIFENTAGGPAECEESRLSDGDCVSTLDEYFDFLNTTARLEADTIDRRNWAATTVEGTVTPSQDHFLPLVLASLVFDIVVTGLLVFGILLARRSSTDVKNVSWKLRAGEALFTVVNLALVVSTLVVALTEPIQYTVSMNLIDFRYKTGVNVIPKSDKLSVDGFGGLQLDSSAIGVVETCFEGDTNTKLGLVSIFFEGFFFAIAEELSPATVGTPAESCKWSASSAFARVDGSICYSIDCSSGSLALVQQEAVETLYRFVISEVVFGIILVDLIVSFVDVCVLLQVYLFERFASTETGKETKAEAIVLPSA